MSEPAIDTMTQPTARVRSVFLHVTKACNLRCAYCYFSASQPLPDEMSTSEFEALWPELVALQPQKVIFTGGEPLLRADILDLLQGLRDADPDHRILRCLNSNGHHVTAALAQQLVGLADEVRVSLDALQERNDALRGAGNFEAALRALETYRRVGFEPKVLITMTSTTVPDLERLMALLLERRITRINVNGVRAVGRALNHPEWTADLHEVDQAIHRATEHVATRTRPVDTPDTAGSNCGVGSFLNVLPNGDVFPCHVLTQREWCCGNVRQTPLREICRRSGLLGKLQRLDFGTIADKHVDLQPLAVGACMGEVYNRTRALPIWRGAV